MGLRELWTRLLWRRTTRRAAEFQEQTQDDAAREALDAWLSRSPRNVEAYLRGDFIDRWLATRGARRELHGRPSRRAASVIVRAARRARTKTAARRARIRTVNDGVFAQAASLVLCFALILWGVAGLVDTRPQFTVYQSLPNEVRRVALNDGSVVELNGGARIRTRFTAGERRIELSRGEALFNVAHDPHRPFRVIAQHTTTEALGTQFTVASSIGAVRVNLVEGHVAVRTGSARTELYAGDEALVRRKSIARRHLGDRLTQNLLAWSTGRMVWEGEPLSTIASELNRVNRTQIVIDSPALEGMRIGGSFSADSPDRFVDALGFLGVETTVIEVGARREFHLRLDQEDN